MTITSLHKKASLNDDDCYDLWIEEKKKELLEDFRSKAKRRIQEIIGEICGKKLPE